MSSSIQNGTDSFRQNPPSSPVDEELYVSNASNSEKTQIRNPAAMFGADAAGSSIPNANLANGWQSVASSLVGQQLDHFRIDTLVGIGGMGAVFRGQDLRLNREVAIKAIAVEGKDPEALRRFRFEAQSAAKLDHPNIARVYYVGETPFWSYIVFEYVEGVNLRDLVQREGLLSVDHSVFLVRQVAQALQHASERQVVHRDIKPSNIVLASNGQAKIVDMGLARFTEMDRSTNDLTASGVTLGTFDYISPEQANDPRDADVRSDLYSLGCTWYYLLTGSPPFPEGTALQKLLMHGSKMPEDPRVVRQDLSDSLVAILRKLIAKRPIDRYQQPEDLIDDLQTLAILEDLKWTRDTDPRETQSQLQSTAWRWLIPYLGAVVLFLGSTIWLYGEWVRSSNFNIPKVVYTASSTELVDGSTTSTTGNRVDATSIISLPADSQSLVVDSAFTSEQLETNRELASTLDQAVERANLASRVSQIVLQSSRLLSTDALKVFNRSRSKLSIESLSGQRTRIEIDTTGKELRESRSWFDCGSNSILIQNCDIIWKTSDPRQSLFLCRPGSQLTLDGCTIQIESTQMANSSSLPSLIQFDQPQTNSVSESVSNVASARTTVRNSVIIGEADAIRYAGPIRVEGQWSNSVIAVTGSAISISRINFSGRTVGSIRLELDSVTTWTPKAWIHSTWTSTTTTPVPIVRTARNCVFSGMESLVIWDVSSNEDWQFWEQSRRGQELTRWIDLRGSDNIYDENLRQLLEANLQNGMTEQLTFAADSKLLAEERGLEFSIPWVKRPNAEQILSAPIRLEQFELFESNFPRGANLKLLGDAIQSGNQP